MTLTLLRTKLYRIRVTDVELEYEGSLGIDPDFMEAAGLLPFEKILVANMANGERLETYAIADTRGSGRVCLNGAAAHKGKIGDRLIVMSFCQLTAEEARDFRPGIARFDKQNRILGQ